MILQQFASLESRLKKIEENGINTRSEVHALHKEQQLTRQMVTKLHGAWFKGKKTTTPMEPSIFGEL